MKEMNRLKNIQIRASELAMRLFRVNVGTGWTGDKISKIHTPRMVRVRKGDVVISRARPLSTGVPKGYHDLTGWHSVEITPEMVGRKIAVFTSIEVKTDKGKLTDEQANFMGQVDKSGGITGIGRCSEDVDKIIHAWLEPKL